MYHVFNMGIGMILIVRPEDVNLTLDILKQGDEKAYVIGEVTNTGSIQWD